MPVILLATKTVVLLLKSVPSSRTPSQVISRRPPVCGDAVPPLSAPPMTVRNVASEVVASLVLVAANALAALALLAAALSPGLRRRLPAKVAVPV